MDAGGRLLSSGTAADAADATAAGVWRVTLGGGGGERREVLIDAADRAVVEGRSLNWSDRGDGGAGQVLVRIDGRVVRLRQAILGVDDPEARVGHRNGDPLDCRRENLMLRTRQQVEREKHKKKQYGGRACSSRFKGVCFDKQTGRWRVGIVVDGKTISLGRFVDEIAAAERYDAAARDHFGEHARLNFPDGIDRWLEQQPAPGRVAA